MGAGTSSGGGGGGDIIMGSTTSKPTKVHKTRYTDRAIRYPNGVPGYTNEMGGDEWKHIPISWIRENTSEYNVFRRVLKPAIKARNDFTSGKVDSRRDIEFYLAGKRKFAYIDKNDLVVRDPSGLTSG